MTRVCSRLSGRNICVLLCDGAKHKMLDRFASTGWLIKCCKTE